MTCAGPVCGVLRATFAAASGAAEVGIAVTFAPFTADGVEADGADGFLYFENIVMPRYWLRRFGLIIFKLVDGGREFRDFLAQ